MEKRSLFEMIFKKKKQTVARKERVQLLNDYSASFYTTDVNKSAVVQSCINAIATHASKFEMIHKKYKGNQISEINGDINFLLQHRPNPLNSPSQFLYKIIYNLYAQNNSFVYIDKDDEGMIRAFYPIVAQNYELLEDVQGTLYLKFNFINGQTYELPYEEIIHVRRMYNKREVFADNNDILKMSVDASNTALQGIENAIKSTASIRGLIKYTNGMLKPEDMKKMKDEFVKDYLNLENESGIAVLDTKSEFTPVKIEPITLTDTQMQFLNENIYKYFGLNEKILNSSFNADEWNAFYESVLEPLAIQLEQEFTAKIFNYKAIKAGHRIVFSVDRIRYQNLSTKIALIKEVGSLGGLTLNEVRKIIDMAPIEGEEGNKRLQTLNVVNSELADSYQMEE